MTNYPLQLIMNY